MSPENPKLVFLLDDGVCGWSLIKHLAESSEVQFRVRGSDILFYLGPDMFIDSYRMAWLTPEEQEDPENKFQDHRVRSSELNDFLSRIEHLASGTSELFIPKF